MIGHNIYFYAELTKIIPNYHQIPLLIWSSDDIGIALNSFNLLVLCSLKALWNLQSEN